jgi:aminoglycoside 3-N-acetyltransferase
MNPLARDVGQLGIRRNTSLFVHSSIKAVGPDAQAEELIAALRDAVGEEGTLLLPTFTDRSEEYFDPDNTPSAMGLVTEVFRQMPGVLRSRHPRHPVAAQGPAARALLEGHENAIGPCGTGTPFEKHARMGGQLLLIGVDLDTLTLLHTAEALLDLPYLQELEGKYLDANGQIQNMKMRQAPGGHRGGVRSFEKLFRDSDMIRYGRVAGARTMLMDAETILDAMIERLRAEPAAALCHKDYCPDCVDFKARIRARQLADTGAQLSVLLPHPPEDEQALNELIQRFGCPRQYTVRSDLKIIQLAAGEAPPPPPDDGVWVLQPAPQDLIELAKPPPGYVGVAYAPLEAARAGIQPFYDVMYKCGCRDHVTDIFVEDGLTDLSGFNSPRLGYLRHVAPDSPVPLGHGHAQLHEIVSAMRMRNASIRYHLVVPEGNLYAHSLRLLKEFFDLLPPNLPERDRKSSLRV